MWALGTQQTIMLLVTLFSRCFFNITTHFQHRKLGWMKLLFLNITLPAHSEKNMQRAVKRALGKYKPPPEQSVCDVPLLCGRKGHERVLSLDPGSTPEIKQICFSDASLCGDILPLSFLLLTCTSPTITQALWNIYKWLTKQMLLNEKVNSACSPLSQ